MAGIVPWDYGEWPGLRPYAGADGSHGGHGIDEILDVINQLSAAAIPSCVVGVRALRYFGAARITDEWDLCVPADRLVEARDLLIGTTSDGERKYEIARPSYPVPNSLRHTFPCLHLKGCNFWFILTPSSDCYVDPPQPDHVERSRNGVPYASLVQFARAVLMQQLWPDISDFIDGMDLDVDWGVRNIGFDSLQKESVKFVERRNERLARHGCDGGLPVMNLEQVWRKKASPEAKEQRIEPMKKGRYFTRWRRFKHPEDPRTKDRPV